MSLGTILALAAGCATNQCQEPNFDPSGLFELGVQAEQSFHTDYRDGSSQSSGGVIIDTSTFGFTNTVAVEYTKSTKTVSLEDTQIALTQVGGGTCDTGSVTDTSSDTAGDTAGTMTSPAWVGTGYVSSTPVGKLSDALGMDLDGFDCNLSLTVSIDASFSPTGDDVSFDVAQTLTLDNSAACQAALETAKEQIFATRSRSRPSSSTGRPRTGSISRTSKTSRA